MMWPFTSKKKEVSNADLRAVLELDKPLSIGRDMILAKGAVYRPPETLKEKLQANRCSQRRGHGDEYWDSVVEVVEKHYKRTADGI